MLRWCLLLLLVQVCRSIETSIIRCLSCFQYWLLINAWRQSRRSYLALKAMSDASLNQIACLLILLLRLLVQFWHHEPFSCILLSLEILLLLLSRGILLRQIVGVASLLFDRLMILIRKVYWWELALRPLRSNAKSVVAGRSGPIFSQPCETTDETIVFRFLIDKLCLLDLFSYHNSFVFKWNHIVLSRFDKSFEALDFLSHLVLLLVFKLKCIINVSQLWFLPTNFRLQFCFYLLVLTSNCHSLVFDLLKVALNAL